MRKKIVMIVIGMLLLATLACGLPSGIGGDGEEPTGNGDEQPTVEEQPLAGESEDFETADIGQLDSYRLEMSWRVESEDGSEVAEMSLVEEWTSDPPARHLVMSGGEAGATGMPFAEMITVEDTSWILTGDTWMEMPGADDMVVSDAWEEFFTDVEEWEYVGQETVNGVNCAHYTSSEEMTVPDPESGGTASINIEAEAWVADASDLPPVVVRQQGQIEGGFFPFANVETPTEGGTIYLQYDLTEINEDITIEPPEDVAQ
jgi:hypothetical protein